VPSGSPDAHVLKASITKQEVHFDVIDFIKHKIRKNRNREVVITGTEDLHAETLKELAAIYDEGIGLPELTGAIELDPPDFDKKKKKKKRKVVKRKKKVKAGLNASAQKKSGVAPKRKKKKVVKRVVRKRRKVRNS
jgi:hypothetical protein